MSTTHNYESLLNQARALFGGVLTLSKGIIDVVFG